MQFFPNLVSMFICTRLCTRGGECRGSNSLHSLNSLQSTCDSLELYFEQTNHESSGFHQKIQCTEHGINHIEWPDTRSFKYLGLGCKMHVDYVLEKHSRRVNFLRSVAGTRDLLIINREST